MSLVTVLMAVMTCFVLLAPVAMATVLVTGRIPGRARATAAAAEMPRTAERLAGAEAGLQRAA